MLRDGSLWGSWIPSPRVFCSRFTCATIQQGCLILFNSRGMGLLCRGSSKRLEDAGIMRHSSKMHLDALLIPILKILKECWAGPACLHQKTPLRQCWRDKLLLHLWGLDLELTDQNSAIASKVCHSMTLGQVQGKVAEQDRVRLLRGQEKGHGATHFIHVHAQFNPFMVWCTWQAFHPLSAWYVQRLLYEQAQGRGYPFQIDGRKQKQLLDCWCLQVCVMLISGSHSVKHGEMRWSLMLCRGPSAYWVNRLLGRRSTTFGWSFTGTKPTSWCFAVRCLQNWNPPRTVLKIFEVFDWGV